MIFRPNGVQPWLDPGIPSGEQHPGKDSKGAKARIPPWKLQFCPSELCDSEQTPCPSPSLQLWKRRTDRRSYSIGVLWAFNKLHEKHLEQCQDKIKGYIQAGAGAGGCILILSKPFILQMRTLGKKRLRYLPDIINLVCKHLPTPNPTISTNASSFLL